MTGRLRIGNAEPQSPLSLHVGRTMKRADQAGENTMTKSKLFVAAIAVMAAFATPAFAQWQAQEPAAFEAQYPNGDRNLVSPVTRESMAYVPSAKSQRPTVIRTTKGK
jgi:hypothetical protein